MIRTAAGTDPEAELASDSEDEERRPEVKPSEALVMVKELMRNTDLHMCERGIRKFRSALEDAVPLIVRVDEAGKQQTNLLNYFSTPSS